MNEIEKAIDDLDDLKNCESISSSHFKEVHGKNLELAISALEKQLSNGWIPVSEGLPEKNGTYIVTQAMHSLKNHNKILRTDTEYADFSNGIWRRAKHLEIIAWQPLPTPYRTEVAK